MSASRRTSRTEIRRGSPYVTEINFLHLEELELEAAVAAYTAVARAMTEQPGFVATNVLRSTDASRLCTYAQWNSASLLESARRARHAEDVATRQRFAREGSGQPRIYDVVYCDDRSAEGVSVISPDYAGTLFINEITTIPGAKQVRLLEMVIANNEIQSKQTPGYQSANFHQSRDGERAVNVSLWADEAQLIKAISAMADMDENFEETVELASPDFRFYALAFAAHA